MVIIPLGQMEILYQSNAILMHPPQVVESLGALRIVRGSSVALDSLGNVNLGANAIKVIVAHLDKRVDIRLSR